MLTRLGYGILAGGLTLLLTGMATANPVVIAAALVPIVAFLLATAIETPYGVEATVELSDTTPHVGQELVVTVRYAVKHGLGPIELHQPLPETFALKEGGGSNLHAAVKGPRKLTGEWSFTVIAAKRGTHDIPPLEVESAHVLGLKAPSAGKITKGFSFDVRPKPAAIMRIRAMPGFANQLFPENDAALHGIRTNDFRDLRRYLPGDAVKIINWKATTRQVGFHMRTHPPLVNEYETEGKKSIWLFIDAAPYMEVGTNIENSFEYSLEAAHGIASFYLDRGYKLGAYVYNHGAQEVMYPDIGGKQLLRLTRLFTRLKTGKGGEGLGAAIDRSVRYLAQERPLIVIVTRLGKADESTFDALKRLRGLSGRRMKHLPILLVTPLVHNLVPSTDPWAADAAELLRRIEKPQVDRARRMGARVVEWDPRKNRFESVLLHAGAGR